MRPPLPPFTETSAIEKARFAEDAWNSRDAFAGAEPTFAASPSGWPGKATGSSSRQRTVDRSHEELSARSVRGFAPRSSTVLMKGRTMTTPSLARAPVIPDSLLAKEATDILREHSTDLLFDHSMRVYLFAAEQGHQRKLRFDPELLYVAAAFHDLGLIRKFSSPDERFEVDGANAARQFLNAHNIAEDQVQTVWEAIALHTTPGIPRYMRSEVALLNSGVLLDVLGVGFDQFPVEVREEIVAKYPRINFKEGFIQEYFAGFAHKPATTYGTVNAGVCERFIPGFKSPNACDLIAAAPFPDSLVQSSTS